MLLLTGTLGYVVLEGYSWMDAFYMCVITVASVGFMEVHPLSNPGRLFTIFLILSNFAALGYVVSTVTTYVMDGDFFKNFKKYKMQQVIDSLNGHVIICGYGRNGSEAAQRILRAGFQVVVIENSATTEHHPEVPLFLHADARVDDVLLQAGITRAAALICTLPDDAENVFIVLTARALNPSINIISRASKDTSQMKLKTAGANNVIMPDKIGGSHMASLLISPDVKEFLDVMSSENTSAFSITELPVNKRATLADVAPALTGATVLGLKRNAGYELNPQASSLIEPGNKLIAMGSKQQLDALKQRLS